ncbi:MAG TPA: peptidylprolyl isomerase, partial [Candidatus Luteococcus avicola]|nr:peptidylprolyl isomerase [Candidatus Luteococcus avicola]
NTNGSQVFLVWEDTQLDPSYTVFGQMDAASTDAVAAVAAQGVAADNVSPNAPALITDVTLG